jgi:signal transduction histidine kinase
MRRLPFRQRLTVWSTIVAGVALVISGLVTALVIHQRELQLLDGELDAQGRHFFSEIAEHGGTNFDWKKIGFEMREWMPTTIPPRVMEVRSGGLLRWHQPETAAGRLPERSGGLHTVEYDGRTHRMLVREHDGIRLVIASDLRAQRSLLMALCGVLIAALPVALAFAWCGGRKIAHLAVRPLEEMTDAAERITADHIEQRLPVPAVADEVQRHAVALNHTFDRLERSYRQALRFSADASHELKSPLTVMRATIEAMLESRELSEHDRQQTVVLLEQARRLAGIISSLLLLARADAGRLVLDLHDENLAVLLAGCVEDASIMAEAKNIRVERSIPEVAMGRVDPLRFAQIVSNLLDNAVKYNHDGGCVRVALTPEGSNWVVRLSNTGPAIPREMETRLFERFFRAEHTTEERGSGLGLGLARELARAHGGDTVFVRSADGWNEFVVRLPVICDSRGPGMKPVHAMESP